MWFSTIFRCFCRFFNLFRWLFCIFTLKIDFLGPWTLSKFPELAMNRRDRCKNERKMWVIGKMALKIREAMFFYFRKNSNWCWTIGTERSVFWNFRPVSSTIKQYSRRFKSWQVSKNTENWIKTLKSRKNLKNSEISNVKIN